MTRIAQFFQSQPFRHASTNALHTDWFDITKPELLPELRAIEGIEFNEAVTQCRVTRKFNRNIITERELK